MEISFGEHWIAHLGPLQVHMDTVLTAWLAMAFLIVLALLVRFNLNRIPARLQAVAEMAINFLKDIAEGQIGKEGRKHIALIASLFLFIFTANLMGQLPWKLLHVVENGRVVEFASPTNDINTTVALAIIVLVYYLLAGIFKKGLFGHLKHYLQPVWFMAPMNMLEDITRPFSLALRLFANILAGEVIVLVLISLVPILLPVPMVLFELFVAFIQAFIFAILAASYIGAVTSEEH